MTSTIRWHSPDGKKTEESSTEHGACPLCLRVAVVRLPTWLIAVQPDDTTHVCHPTLGGCNNGFADHRPTASAR